MRYSILSLICLRKRYYKTGTYSATMGVQPEAVKVKRNLTSFSSKPVQTNQLPFGRHLNHLPFKSSLFRIICWLNAGEGSQEGMKSSTNTSCIFLYSTTIVDAIFCTYVQIQTQIRWFEITTRFEPWIESEILAGRRLLVCFYYIDVRYIRTLRSTAVDEKMWFLS